MIHSSLTAVRYFDNDYEGKKPVAWKEYCVEYWLKELHESRDRCSVRRDITEIILKTALNTTQTNKLIQACQYFEKSYFRVDNIDRCLQKIFRVTPKEFKLRAIADLIRGE